LGSIRNDGAVIRKRAPSSTTAMTSAIRQAHGGECVVAPDCGVCDEISTGRRRSGFPFTMLATSASCRSHPHDDARGAAHASISRTVSAASSRDDLAFTATRRLRARASAQWRADPPHAG